VRAYKELVVLLVSLSDRIKGWYNNVLPPSDDDVQRLRVIDPLFARDLDVDANEKDKNDHKELLKQKPVAAAAVAAMGPEIVVNPWMNLDRHDERTDAATAAADDTHMLQVEKEDPDGELYS
jgi:hypothetical protein